MFAWWLKCSPMARETSVQSRVESYQRLKKWYLMPPGLTLSFIRYRSRLKWSNPGKGVGPSHTPWCSSYWKGSFQVTFDYGCQLYLLTYQSATLKNFISYPKNVIFDETSEAQPWFYLFYKMQFFLSHTKYKLNF